MPRQTGQGGSPPSLADAQSLQRQGDLEGALEAYLALEAYGPAARIARQLNRPDQAAELHSRAEEWYRAAVFYRQLRQDDQCLVHLLRVPATDPSYREACIYAITLALDLGRVDDTLARFLTPFISQPPTTDREVEAFYDLAEHHRKGGGTAQAGALFELIAADRPHYRDVEAKLRKLRVRGAEAPGPEAGPGPPMNVGHGGAGSGSARRSGATVAYEGFRRTPFSAPAVEVVIGPPDLKPARATDPPPPTGHDDTASAPPQPVPPAESGGLLREGVLVGKRFFLEAKIGQGGMASVYRAADRGLNETVAIKFFVPSDESSAARFKQEVTILRRLSHPNIVRLFEFGTYYDYLYVAMELLEGLDLGQLLAERPVDLAEGVDYLVQACHALQHVHDHGITHRDIKPGNFFIAADGALKLMDFGIAKRRNPVDLTRTGLFAGTPAYMAPEQFDDLKKVNHLADLYALGCVAYRIFAGRPPFSHEGLVQMMVMHATDAPLPPRQLNPRIPLELERIILRLLAKSPGDRIPSCRELAERLTEVGASLAPRE